MKTKVLKVILTPCEDGGFVAEIPEIEGCVCRGGSYREACRNLWEAIYPFRDRSWYAYEGIVLSVTIATARKDLN